MTQTSIRFTLIIKTMVCSIRAVLLRKPMLFIILINQLSWESSPHLAANQWTRLKTINTCILTAHMPVLSAGIIKRLAIALIPE